jgi:uncharacterized membrane protein
MPAVMIRQLEALSKIMEHAATEERRELLLDQAAMILRASEESVPEPADRDDVKREYDVVIAAAVRVAAAQRADQERAAAAAEAEAGQSA